MVWPIRRGGFGLPGTGRRRFVALIQLSLGRLLLSRACMAHGRHQYHHQSGINPPAHKAHRRRNMPSPAPLLSATQAEAHIPLRPSPRLAFVIATVQLAAAQQATFQPGLLGSGRYRLPRILGVRIDPPDGSGTSFLRLYFSTPYNRSEKKTRSLTLSRRQPSS